VQDENYRSGADFTLEFVGRRYAFSRRDFAERVAAAARRLGLGGPDDQEAPEADRHLVEHLTADPAAGADLVYWLRKLVFRSAWLDQRVKLGLVEARFDEHTGDFHYDAGHHELPEVGAGAPSWSAMQYRR
jgi:hypothetical protein